MSEKKSQRLMTTFLSMGEAVAQGPPLLPIECDVALTTFPDTHEIDVRASLLVESPAGSEPDIRVYLGIQGMNVFSLRDVRVNKAAAQHRYRSPSLDIRLPRPFTPKETAAIDFLYHGTVDSPKNYVGVRGTELMGEGLWLPAVCFPGPRFKINMKTDVPEGEATAAPGAPASVETRGGRTVTKWMDDVPVSSVTVVSGPFSVRSGSVGTTEVHTMVQRGYESSAEDLVNSSTAVLRTGESWFGPLPLRRIYLVQPRRHDYGEYAHMPFIVYAKTNLAKSPDDASRMRLFEATAHELGHFWWGNVVASDSINEGWLSEGFADFTKVLALEEAFGRPEAVRMLDNMCEVVRKQGDVPPLAVINMSHPKQGQIVRRQGGLFLEAAREKYGDDSMKALIRHIYKEFADATMTTKDFIDEAVACLPGEDVGTFLRSHLYGTPRYHMEEGRVAATLTS